jgi:uncharacterized surface protein with fasciclin (FAS1) repeats
MKRLFLKMTAAAAVGALVGACGGTDDGDDESPGTLMDVAFRSGEISALLTAARLADLETALRAPDANVTVLAPTNEAWGALSGQLGFRTIQAMLESFPVSTLQQILSYHILPTRVAEADMRAASSQTTLLVQSGSPVSLPLSIVEGDLNITDTIGRVGIVNVFDVPADNGVFHVIDRVLMPAGLLSVLQTVQSNPERFGDLVATASGLPSANPPEPNSVIAALQGPSVTLFAPVDEAFEDIVQVLPTLTDAQKTTVLLHHVLGSTVLSSAIPFGSPVATASGQTITINAGGPAIATIDDSSATDANITQVDIRCTNGVVHVIDKVLLPTI